MRYRALAVCALALAATLGVSPCLAQAETSAEVREQVAAAQAELEGLAAQVEEGEQKVQGLQDEIDALAEESVQLQSQIIQDRDRLSQIVSTSYKENSETRTLALLLSSESMDELISQFYYAQKVSDWEVECIDQLNADKASLDERMTQLRTAKDEQDAALEELEEQQDQLSQKVGELEEKADQLEEEEREAARKAAEEAARKAAEEKARREAEEKARQEALAAAAAAGDVETKNTDLSGDGWISCVASAYTIADNDPPGSTATASGIPLDESVPTVAMPMSMNPSRFYGKKIEISYNGISVIATVTDCGYMGGGSRGLDLTPAIFRAFGFSTADGWGLRTVSYRFL